MRPIRVTALPHLLPVRTRYHIAGSAALLMLVALCALTVSVWGARNRMLHGAAELRIIRSQLSSPEALRQPAARQELHLQLQEAQQSFVTARDLLSLWPLVLSHLGWLPVVGGQLQAATPAADTAVYATTSAIRLTDGLSPVLGAMDHARNRKPILARLAPILQAEHPQFEAAHREAVRAAAALRRLPKHTGDEVLDRMSAHLRALMPDLTQGAALLALAPTLLGTDRPSRYLFAWEDPHELRAAGGFIGASDLITARNGTISHRFSGRIPSPRELNTVPPPLPESAYTPETYWVFSDSNWSPDFPLSARLERWFYGEDTGQWAQGVIDFVDTAIPSILHATGPIYLSGYHTWVNAGNVERLAQHYVNGSYQGPVQKGPRDTVRKQFFHAMMKALQRRVQSLPLARLPQLGVALSEAVRHRDILLFDRRPAVEAAIVASGAAGRMPHPGGDLLYVVDDNRSYNKINPFVEETVKQAVSLRPGRWLYETVTLHYRVRPSPANLEGYGPGLGRLSLQSGYGPGLGPIGTKHDYQDFLRVYVPRGSQLLAMSGLSPWAPEEVYDSTQFAGRLLVREDRMVTVTIRYRVPADVLNSSGMYRLTVPHQPGANLAAVTLKVHTTGRTISRTIVAPRGDWHVAIPARISSPSASSPPLSIRQWSDPYIPYASFHDPRHPL